VEAQVRAVSGLGGVVGCFSPLPEEVWELGEGLYFAVCPVVENCGDMGQGPGDVIGML